MESGTRMKVDRQHHRIADRYHKTMWAKTVHRLEIDDNG